MVFADYYPDSVSSGVSVDVDKEFTLPTMTDVSYVKVFIWDSLENAIPYTTEIDL